MARAGFVSKLSSGKFGCVVGSLLLSVVVVVVVPTVLVRIVDVIGTGVLVVGNEAGG